MPPHRAPRPAPTRSGATATRTRRAALWVAAAVLGVACTSSPGGDAAAPSEQPATDGAAASVQPRWAVVMSGPSDEDEIDGLAASPDGAVYLTGKFERATTIGDTTLESAGAADIPLARVAPDGEVEWVARHGGPGEDNFFDIDADERGAIASGIFEGTVDFGGTTLTSAGGVDCAVVAFDPTGAVRWATSLGGPATDGCNEITIAPDGSVVTSLDTAGGWDSPAGPIPALRWSDTLLLRLDRSGEVVWARRVGGDGPQRGKSLAVGPDGSVVFGGDSVGPLTADGTPIAPAGGRRDGWITEWSPEGALRWSTAWGGAGDDLVKGLAYEDDSIYAVGTFRGPMDVGGHRLDGGEHDALFVTRVRPGGTVAWAARIRSSQALAGAEVVTAPGGGVLFAGAGVEGTEVSDPTGEVTPFAAPDAGTAWLVHYRPDGSVALASTIAGTQGGNPDEITRVGDRVTLDVKVRGSGNTVAGTAVDGVGKDGSVWAIDLDAAGG